VSKRKWFLPLAPAILGLFPLLNSLNNPRVQTLRVSDVLRLIAVGMCFGMALAMFFAALEQKPDKEQHQDRQR
jgi:hypothetical protein